MSTESFLDGKVTLHCGDCLDVLKTLEPNSVDAIVSDPPYGLGKEPDPLVMLRAWLDGGHYDVPSKSGFMGKSWDLFVPQPAIWREAFRVLKPGGHVVTFFGTRTYDLGALAIRLAGFEVRDMASWLYGSGFPKSHDVSKAIDKHLGAAREQVRDENPRNPKATGGGRDGTEGATRPWIEAAIINGYHEKDGPIPATAAAAGWGTALKPACEPIVLARKPLIGTVAENWSKHGTGALNIDGCRVEHQSEADRATATPGGKVTSALRAGIPDVNRDGRVDVARPDTSKGRWPANIIHDGSDEVLAAFPDNLSSGTGAVKKATGAGTQANAYGKESRPVGTPNIEYGDTGSAARFFYTAKADADDRIGSKHPTVKPVDLMQWLVRLVTPPGGTVLDPFSGTGTTGEAAFREGFRAVLIEREAEYQNDIRRRMALCIAGPGERKRESTKARLKDKPQDAGPLFAGSDTPPPRGRQIYGVFADDNRPDGIEVVTPLPSSPISPTIPAPTTALSHSPRPLVDVLRSISVPSKIRQ